MGSSASSPHTQSVSKYPSPSVYSTRASSLIRKSDVSKSGNNKVNYHDAMNTESLELHGMLGSGSESTAKIIRILMEAESIPSVKSQEKLRYLEQCYSLLERQGSSQVPPVVHILMYVKEGECYMTQKKTNEAQDCFSRAIALAEQQVALRAKDIYIILRRYVQAMIGLSRLWYETEKEVNGFVFTQKNRTSVPAALSGTSHSQSPLTESHHRVNEKIIEKVDPNYSSVMSARASSVLSMATSVSSGGSVFSLNHAMLKAMVPRYPRRTTGPDIQRLPFKLPHMTSGTEYIHQLEEEFVLHSTMSRELIASPCELLLLRCCEVVELGHCRQSELLTPVLEALAQLYEDLELYGRSILLIRRCVGIILSVYDYDHPLIVNLRIRLEKLSYKHTEQLRVEMATKIQSTWRMYSCMCKLEEALGRPVHRHIWIPHKYRPSDNDGFLNEFLRGGLAGEEEGDELVPSSVIHADNMEEADEGPHVLTAFLPNAKVIGSTQETETATHLEHDYETGMEVLAVKTTTITKTVAEADRSTEAEENTELGTNPTINTASSSRSLSYLTAQGRGRPPIHAQRINIDGQNRPSKNIAISIPSHPDGELKISPKNGTFPLCEPTSTQTVNTTTEALVMPSEEGDVLTIKQVTVTQTVTEQDVETSSSGVAVAPVTSTFNNQLHNSIHNESNSDDWTQEDLYNGIVDDTHSESTFFTHRSEMSHSSKRLPNVSMIARDDAMRESMPTGRLSSISGRHQNRVDQFSQPKDSIVPVKRLPASHTPKIPVQRFSSNSQSSSGQRHTSSSSVSLSNHSALGAQSQRRGGKLNPHTTARVDGGFHAADSSGPAGNVSLPVLKGEVGPSMGCLQKSRSGSTVGDSQSHVSSILSSARRSRAAWASKDQE